MDGAEGGEAGSGRVYWRTRSTVPPTPRRSMIPYATYKVVHYLGIFLLLTALAATLGRAAGFAVHATAGGGATAPDPWKRRLGITHGIALFLILLGGFGMLARLDVTHGLGLPGWIWAKLGIWTLLGGTIVLARRSPALSGRLLVAVPALAVLAGIVALYKPF
jgi:hypothetical protein